LNNNNNNISKGTYFEWICEKCKWGARGYDQKAIMDIKSQHDKLGCKEFISMVESKGKRIENGQGTK
jgi:hypothetical protein